MPDYRTEYQKVYEAIRNAIMDGEYAPGERLVQRHLAKKYRTTTITVREALRFLENAGLVVIEPRWGAMVHEITAERIRGRYVVREALEGMAARLAAVNIVNMNWKNELLALAERCDTELPQDRLSRREKANLHFMLHEKIVQLSANEELICSISRISLHTILLSNAYHIDWTSDDMHRHKKLIIALASGDPELAEATMRAHVRDGCRMEIKALEDHALSS
ncbi:MAG: GntR family transcriptional regulator [Chloroflexi bacterium]|nr:GntR family transcriptional regulator [Chloroflexota bacterium]